MKLNSAIVAISIANVNAYLRHEGNRVKKSEHQNQQRQLQTDVVEVIISAVSDISSLIESQESLAPKYVRLGFHDCVGGCDGCVDLSNDDNNGLDIPIESLRPVVDNETYQAAGLSRADIWALAAITGANYAKPDTSFFFHPGYIGRTNCEDAGTPCLDADGQNTSCTETSGPHRHLPLSDLDTEDVLDFFNDEFGFTDNEIVALMGAHTIGVASRGNSGFNGSAGWVRNENRLDNEYYAQIVGNGNSLDELFDAPNWFQETVNNDNGAPDRVQWERNQNDESPLIMLNADIALVRTFGNNLDRETGDVSCRFKNNNACDAAPTLSQMSVYRNDNEVWLTDFKDVFEKMLIHGYEVDENCNESTCLREVVGYNPEEPNNGGGGNGGGGNEIGNDVGNGNGGGRGNGGNGGGGNDDGGGGRDNGQNGGGRDRENGGGGDRGNGGGGGGGGGRGRGGRHKRKLVNLR